MSEYKNWEDEFDKYFEKELESDHEYYTSQLKLAKNFFRQKEKEWKEENELQIGFLRQWLNEDRITDPKKMITNEMIKVFISEETRKNLVQEIREMPLEIEGMKYEDVQWVRFLIISKLKENAD